MKAPGFGDRRKDMLQDIATLTGGIVLSLMNSDIKLDNITHSISLDKPRK